jgi:transposase-like protein
MELASGEVFVRVNGRLFYLWRAIDHEGEVLDAVVPTTRDKRAALTVLKRLQKRYGAHDTSLRMDCQPMRRQ